MSDEGSTRIGHTGDLADPRSQAETAVLPSGEPTPAPMSGLEPTLAPSGVEPTLAVPHDPAPHAGALPQVAPSSYELGDELARGGMGRIVEARDRRLGRPVAIKELLHHSAGFRTRFEREALITARLQHPSIVPIYEAGVWPSGEPFYAMKLVSGRPFHEIIAETDSLADRIALLPQMLAASEALAYAHRHRIIHRDLKPHNVLAGEFGEVVVIDWGLAKDLAIDDGPDEGPFRTAGVSGTQTVAGDVMGTPAYMPPEQARGERVDQRADVYSLGAMLYHLLAARMPYDKRHPSALVASVIAGPPEPLASLVPEVPPDLVAIVDKAMARDAADRYADAGALAVDLKRFLTGQLVAVHAYSFGELARRWIRKHRTAVAVGSVAFALLVAVGVIAVWRVLAANAEARDERDEAVRQTGIAEEQRGLADQQRATAEATATALFAEQGRQELLAGHTDRAATLLAQAYRAGATPALRLELGIVRDQLAQRAPRLSVAKARRVVIDPRTRRLLVDDDDATHAFDAETGKPLPLAMKRILLRSPNGKFVVDDDMLRKRLWDVAAGTSVDISDGGVWHYGAPTAGTVADDGSAVAVARDKELYVWRRDGGKAVAIDVGDVRDVACDATCSVVAVQGDRELVFVRIADGKTAVLDHVATVAIASDGSRFLAGYDERDDQGGYTVVRGEPLAPATWKRARRPTQNVEVVFDREATQALAYTSRDGELVDADLSTVRPLAWPSPIKSATFAGDDLVTAHEDFAIRVWRNLALVATFDGLDAAIDDVAVQADDGRVRRVAAVGGDRAQLWNLVPPGDDELERRSRPTRATLERTGPVVDVSEDGSVALTCEARDTCAQVSAWQLETGKTTPIANIDRTAWLATARWIAMPVDGGVHLVTTGGVAGPAFACAATRASQLWLSEDGATALCAAGGDIAWSSGGKPARVVAPCTNPRITSRAGGEVLVRCYEGQLLVDAARGALVPRPTIDFDELSEDGTRLLAHTDGRITVLDRKGTLVAQFGRSIEYAAERHGLVYTVDGTGLIAIWDRETGAVLAERPIPWTGTERTMFDVSHDGSTIAVHRGDQHTVWKVVPETRPADVVGAEIAKSSPWQIAGGRLVRRAPAPQLTDKAPPRKSIIDL